MQPRVRHFKFFETELLLRTFELIGQSTLSQAVALVPSRCLHFGETAVLPSEQIKVQINISPSASRSCAPPPKKKCANVFF